MVGLGLAALVCTGPAMAQTEGERPEAEVLAGEVLEGEVLEVHGRLIEAYTQGDTETFSSLLDPSAELLIFHPRGYFQFSVSFNKSDPRYLICCEAVYDPGKFILEGLD